MLDKIIIKENSSGDWLNEYKNWFFWKDWLEKSPVTLIQKKVKTTTEIGINKVSDLSKLTTEFM